MKCKNFSRKVLTIISILVVVIIVINVVWVLWWCPAGEGTTVFLVRHAEYDLNTGHLTLDGEQRANELAEVLTKVDMDVIYATQYDRTQETAQPVAYAKNLQSVIYDTTDLDSFVDQVKQDHAGEVVLIVGHSNTVPLTIDKLVGVSVGYSINSDEFHKIFIVTILESSEWWVTNLKYGETP
jgi:2,3-bisphosphoglycerate-dependent phosphoglycerate mutase